MTLSRASNLSQPFPLQNNLNSSAKSLGSQVDLARANAPHTQLSMDAPMYYPSQECHRMHLLRSTLPICLDKTFDQFSYAAFCSCFDEKVTLKKILRFSGGGSRILTS